MIQRDHNIFYLPGSLVPGKEVVIRGEELRHIRTVLRHRVGGQIFLTDGRGHRYLVEITSVERSAMRGKIVSGELMAATSAPDLTLGFVPVKGLRNETIIEKGTEIGVRRFVLFPSSRSVVKRVSFHKVDRLRKIAAGAMVQSRQYYLPEIECLKTTGELLARDTPYDRIFVADPGGQKTIVPRGEKILLLVGPEGGFTVPEIEYFTERGAEPLSLGLTRLRSETAALVAAIKILVAYKQL